VKSLDIFQSKYTIVEIIKKNSKKFSCIVIDVHGTKYFCKVKSVNFVSNEELDIYKFLKKNPHMYINKIYNVYKSDRFVIVISEYIKGIILGNYKWKTNLHEIFGKICEGIMFLHTNMIVHSDLKLDNILVNNRSEPIIIDFDLSRKMGGSIVKTQEVSGTKFFIPPESVHDNIYTDKNDIWALGIIFFMLCIDLRIVPNDKSFFELDISNNIETQLCDVCDDYQIIYVIIQMTNKNYIDRPDITTVLYELNCTT
jgi:serine/threonine protein kinase